MREILFRGKQKGIMNWVEGTGIFTDGINIWLSANEPNRPIAYGLKHKIVLSETVGQFTGMTDKNGKKIFEGDVVKIGSFMPGADDWVCAIDWDYSLFEEYKYVWKTKCEVIGNIHDNPELLENP